MGKIFKENTLFFLFLILLFFLLPFFHGDVGNFLSYIDFPTIRALICLLVITTGLKVSGFFDYISQKYISKFKSERSLALFLMILSVFFSMFLTNDITLFIVVPLTLSIGKYFDKDLSKFIIFEAISVNIGSLLTPFGNPQNIFLFRKWKIGTLYFVKLMFPIFLVSFILLMLFIFFSFPDKNFSYKGKQFQFKWDKPLFLISLLFFVFFIFSMEFNFVRYLLVILILFYFLFYRRVLREFDYFLILTFVLMFIDFHLISSFSHVRKFIFSFNLNSSETVFNLSAIISQVISNVPGAIFMTKFTSNYKMILYGVNVAGTGLFIGSMANIIALRIFEKEVKRGIKIYLNFHKYSIPYFLISYLLVYYILIR